MLACSGDPPNSPPGGVPPSPPQIEVERAIIQGYQQTFSEQIPRPAYFVCGGEKITTTAYLPVSASRARLLTLYTSIDGRSVLRSSSATVMRPAGAFKALVAIVRYAGTFTDDAVALWEAAQQAISADYASFTAAEHGGPIVTFEHTNVILDSSQVANPSSAAAVTAALEQQGRNVAEYDFLISVNLVPGKGEGGFAVPGAFAPAFIYMGNFGSFRAPLTAANMTSIAGAVYYHEVSHHWGWPGTHDWTTNACPLTAGYAAGLSGWLPALLFGWKDVDGDGVAEILDSTPYGRSP